MDLEAFCDLVWTRGRELYRDLPWRRTYDPYAIWISEVMLQQTQVSRVLDRWQRWLERFPTVDALAAAAPAGVARRSSTSAAHFSPQTALLSPRPYD